MFLPKFMEKGKEYCKMGQSLESPFAQKLLSVQKRDSTFLKLIIFTA
jgi:hypothetical protein